MNKTIGESFDNLLTIFCTPIEQHVFLNTLTHMPIGKEKPMLVFRLGTNKIWKRKKRTKK